MNRKGGDLEAGTKSTSETQLLAATKAASGSRFEP
jgi:hypothetical protein